MGGPGPLGGNRVPLAVRQGDENPTAGNRVPLAVRQGDENPTAGNRAATRHRRIAVYDPAALPADLGLDPDLAAQDPKPLPARDVERLAALGLAVFFDADEDGEAGVRIQVGEPPAGLRERAKVTPAALHVASGTLAADGIEFLTRPGQERTHAIGTRTPVPPGQYAVEVLDLRAWKLGAGRRELAAAFTPADRVVGSLLTLHTLVGGLVAPLVLFLGLPLVGVTGRKRGWQAAASLAAVLAAVVAVIVGSFFLRTWLEPRWPVLTRVQRARERFEAENPDVLVALRPST
jgi:hypothetical protein